MQRTEKPAATGMLKTEGRPSRDVLKSCAALADPDAIPAAVFGKVERLVGSVKDRFFSVIGAKACHPSREGNRYRFTAKMKRQGADVGTKFVQNSLSIFRRRFRKQQREFFTAKTGDEIRFAQPV